MNKLILANALALALALTLAPRATAGEAPKKDDGSLTGQVTQGALRFKDKAGRYVECPLKHTDVRAEISGFVARVKVVQTFVNAARDRIEAVYVFPLPHESAVDGMTMTVGERRIVGVIKKRAEARRIYRQAVAAGKTAALLEQERPNIFVQSVGNIGPGQTVKVEITYVDVLKYDGGVYAFHFPMVVGPRFNPPGWTGGVGAVRAGAPDGAGGQPVQVPYLKAGQRSGHDISLSVKLDAGVPVRDFKSVNHQVALKRTGPSAATCSIKPGDNIPNKDFELRYAVLGKKPQAAVLAHSSSDEADGYFLLVLQPSDRVITHKAPPREITFLVDVSGSMSGKPTAQVKRALKHFLGKVSPRDRIQLITFAGTPYNVFEKPQPATEENVKALLDYSEKYKAGGGTMMLPAVRRALGGKAADGMVRIVVMLTDGYIGDEERIIKEVAGHCGDRVRMWCLGIGTSVNRYLVDGVARHGGGLGEVLSIRESEEEVGKLVAGMMGRIHRPQISDVAVNWGALEVKDTYPQRIPDLWPGRPVLLLGRYSGGGRARVRVEGSAEGRAVSIPIEVSFPGKAPENRGLSTAWARRRIESLADRMLASRGNGQKEIVEEITRVALEHRLMTRYTSFVAVEEKLVRDPKKPSAPPRRVRVPVELPNGMDKQSANGHEDAISDIPLGGSGMVGSIGVGGGGVAGVYGYRSGGGRKKAVARFGGSSSTESAVEAQLKWTARHQEADGSWNPAKFGPAAGIKGQVTGLTALSFLGAGYTTKLGKYKTNVKRAIDWIIARQKAGRRGGFAVEDADSGRAHAVLTLALSEAYGMSRDPALKAPAQAAVDRALGMQKRSSGWARRPGGAPDAVTTVWFVMALKSAKIAGLKVDAAGFRGALAFLDKAAAGKGCRAKLDGQKPDPTSTMAAATARLFMGQPREKVAEMIRWAAAEGRKGGLLKEKLDPLYAYFGTLACFQLGGADWKSWNAAMRSELLKGRQSGGPKDGSAKDIDGSWPPAPGAADRGRLYATVLAELTLEVYYRYLPMYSK